MRRHISLLTAILCIAISATIPADASEKPNYSAADWTVHSAFNNKPRKIIDTPDGVFFFTHQHLYTTGTTTVPYNLGGYYSTPSGAVFYFDKHNPQAGIQDFAKLTTLAGADMRALNYDPVSRRLVIAYLDGGIDIIGPDLSSTYIADIKNRDYPDANSISAINFDADGNIWLGTKHGFVRIDGSSLTVRYAPSWSEAVTDIVPVGDKVIAVIGNKICEAPASANLALRSSFKPSTLTGTTGNIGTVGNLMSLNGSFATLSTAGAIHFYTPAADGGWSVQNIATSVLILSAEFRGMKSPLDDNSYVINRVDHTVTPTAEGFYVAATDYAYMICRPETAGQTPTLKKVALPKGGLVYSSSYDGRSFWFYTDPRKFTERSLSDGKWTDVRSLEPNAPLTAKDNQILYSPTQGLIVVNQNPQELAQIWGEIISSLVAGYKNGKWTDLSPCHNPAYLTETDSKAKAAFDRFIGERRWMCTPMGASIDPLYPDVLHMGSKWLGAASVYLDDPRKNPFLITFTTPAFEGFNPLPLLPFQNWEGPILSLGADADNVQWFYYGTNTIGGLDNGAADTDITLFAITPEGRTCLADDDIQTHFQGVKKLVFPSTLKSNYWMRGTALRHPSNRNKIVTYTFEGDATGSALRICNHKGNLDRGSYGPDNITYIRYFRLETGALYQPSAVHSVIENPYNGDIVISTMHDTFIINLKSPVIGNTIDARSVTFKDENGHPVQFRPSTRSNCAAYDEYGRLWVGTSDSGVIGLSADGNTIVAHYDKTNSPLSDNDIHGLGWNPDTKSLFISSADMIAEVRPDSAPALTAQQTFSAPAAYPATVPADFGGTVAFHNIPSGVALRVRDSKGTTVRELDAAEEGALAYWDLLDGDGQMVPSGLYSVSDASGLCDFVIYIPVSR